MYGLAHGSITFGASDIDQSVASVLNRLLANPHLQREFRLVLSPYDPVTETTLTKYLSTHGRATGTGNTPANQLFSRAVANPYNARFALGGVDKLFTDAADSSAEPIDLLNGEGRLDAYAGYNWDNRVADLYIGELDADWDTGFERVARYLTDELDWSPDVLKLHIRDRRALFDRELQERLYWGTGPCLRFDGTTDHVSFGDILDQGATDSFTVELLFRESQSGSARYLFSKQNAATGGAGFHVRFQASNNLLFYVEDGAANAGTAGVAGVAYRDGAWHRLSCVCDRSAQLLYLYIDGALVGTSATISAVGSLANALALYLARLGGSTANELIGDLDDFRFWSYARTQAEIQADMHRELTDAEVQTYEAASQLALYCKINEKSGSTIADETTNGYDGTITGATWVGSGEGESEVAGKPKPKKYGVVRQGECVLVDTLTTGWIYQVHDGACEGIGEDISTAYAVRDGGVALTFAGDVADVYDAGDPGAGNYYTSKATGLLRVSDTPQGALTADVWGENAGALGFVTTAADIVREIATVQAGLTDPDDLHTQTFDDLNTANNATTGYATGLAPIKIGAAFSEVLSSVGAWWGMDRLGRLRVGRITDPSTLPARYRITVDDYVPPEEGGTLERSSPGRPVELVRLGYQRYEVVLKQGESLTSLTAADKQDFADEYRRVASGDETSATFFRWNTSIDVVDDAQAEADRILAMLETQRHFYLIRVKSHRTLNGLQPSRAKSVMFTYQLGDVIDLVLSRWGLDSGQNFVVTGITEDAGGYGAADSVLLQLWG